jgi:hypothetical protein
MRLPATTPSSPTRPHRRDPYGFEHGGRAVIRPDGYLGLVGALDADVDGYFAQLTG